MVKRSATHVTLAGDRLAGQFEMRPTDEVDVLVDDGYGDDGERWCSDCHDTYNTAAGCSCGKK